MKNEEFVCVCVCVCGCVREREGILAGPQNFKGLSVGEDLVLRLGYVGVVTRFLNTSYL